MIETTNIHDLTLRPITVYMHVPPAVWKGDRLGHIGNNDTFFWVLEGECFLTVGEKSTIVRPGQLAFLPKGVRRAYTHASERFVMYEMAFSASVNEGQDLMQFLQLQDGEPVVDIEDKEEMSRLFEESYHKELFKDPLYDVAWCSNLMEIIRLYTEAHRAQRGKARSDFSPVLQMMEERISQPLKTEELAAAVYMQPTYFIRCFKAAFGIPPQAYLARLRIYQAMGLLASTDQSTAEIAAAVGFADPAYFNKVFKRSCGISPKEYRNAFKKT